MAWIRLDDQIATHPKFVAAGPVASWLWVCGQSYCGRYLTDGFIADGAVSTLGVAQTPKKHAETLVAVGLWDRADGGYRVHDYAEYQPTRDEVVKRRETRRESGRLGGQRSGESRQAKPKQDASPLLPRITPVASSVGSPSDEAKRNPVPVPVPSASPKPSPPEGAGDDFWQRWRALFQETHRGATVPLQPRNRELDDVIFIVSAYPDMAYLCTMVELFFWLGRTDGHDLKGKVPSIGMFRYWAPKLDSDLRAAGRGPAASVAS